MPSGVGNGFPASPKSSFSVEFHEPDQNSFRQVTLLHSNINL